MNLGRSLGSISNVLNRSNKSYGLVRSDARDEQPFAKYPFMVLCESNDGTNPVTITPDLVDQRPVSFVRIRGYTIPISEFSITTSNNTLTVVEAGTGDPATFTIATPIGTPSGSSLATILQNNLNGVAGYGTRTVSAGTISGTYTVSFDTSRQQFKFSSTVAFTFTGPTIVTGTSTQTPNLPWIIGFRTYPASTLVANQPIIPDASYSSGNLFYKIRIDGIADARFAKGTALDLQHIIVDSEPFGYILQTPSGAADAPDWIPINLPNFFARRFVLRVINGYDQVVNFNLQPWKVWVEFQ